MWRAGPFLRGFEAEFAVLLVRGEDSQSRRPDGHFVLLCCFLCANDDYLPGRSIVIPAIRGRRGLPPGAYQFFTAQPGTRLAVGRHERCASTYRLPARIADQCKRWCVPTTTAGKTDFRDSVLPLQGFH